MAHQNYASLAIESQPDLRLPLSPSAARRLCLLVADSVNSSANADRVECDWLVSEPGLLLWSASQSGQTDLNLAATEKWLRSSDGIGRVINSITSCEIDSAKIATLIQRTFQSEKLTSIKPDSRQDLNRLLNLAEAWLTLSANRSGAARGGERRVNQLELLLNPNWCQKIRSQPQLISTRFGNPAAWEGDAAWQAALLSLCNQRRLLLQQSASFADRLEQEKLLSMKQLAYGASHEINNPLANIATRAQTLLTEETDPKRRRTLATINHQAFRAHEMIADMMLFAMPPKMEISQVCLANLLQEVVANSKPLAEANGVKIILDTGSTGNGANIAIETDEAQLLVAMRCICVNALEAMPTGGIVSICVDETSGAAGSELANATDGQLVSVTIRDNGPGIPAEIRRHMFDPFFSGREAGRGLGFGLSKAWRIVTELGGQILVNAPATGGSEFSVMLPRKQSRTKPN